jgi:hypothetical protein
MKRPVRSDRCWPNPMGPELATITASPPSPPRHHHRQGTGDHSQGDARGPRAPAGRSAALGSGRWRRAGLVTPLDLRYLRGAEAGLQEWASPVPQVPKVDNDACCLIGEKETGSLRIEGLELTFLGVLIRVDKWKTAWEAERLRRLLHNITGCHARDHIALRPYNW